MESNITVAFQGSELLLQMSNVLVSISDRVWPIGPGSDGSQGEVLIKSGLK